MKKAVKRGTACPRQTVTIPGSRATTESPMESAPLEVFKTHVDVAQWWFWVMVGLDDPKGPLQPRFHGSPLPATSSPPLQLLPGRAGSAVPGQNCVLATQEEPLARLRVRKARPAPSSLHGEHREHLGPAAAFSKNCSGPSRPPGCGLGSSGTARGGCPWRV